MRKALALVAAGILLSVATFLHAQTSTPGTIRGQVVDASTSRPLENVNVTLQRTPDSTVVTGTATDRNGRFDFNDVPAGEYLCRFSLIRYRTKQSVTFLNDSRHRSLNIGTIALSEAMVSLDEVLVTLQRALFNNQMDRKVYNVDPDVLAKTGSASDVLQTIPSVQVDIDGNVSLRGSSSVLSLINGKNSPLMGKNRAAELQLKYSRRTNRPEGDDLNPFPEYRDARNISAGNPNLLPEYIHSVELGCKLQNDMFSLLPSVHCRYTYNKFTSVTTRIDDSTLLTTKENLSSDQSTGAEMIFSADGGDLFAAHASANVFFQRIDASNLGYSGDKSIATWSGALTFSLSFTRPSMVQVNANCSSARVTPQGEYRPSYVVNVGIRQELLGDKLSLVLTVADLFKTLKREMELNTPTLKQTVTSTRDSRIIYFGLTFNCGTPPKKAKEEGLKYDDSI